MRGAREVRQERFGGLNLLDDDIADHEARDMLNMVGRPRGGVRTRDGSSLFNAAALTSSVLPAGWRFTDMWPVGYQRATSLKSIGGGQINKDAKPAILAIAMDTATPISAVATNAKVVTLFGDGTVIDHGALTLFGNVVGHFGNGYFGAATGPNGIYLAGNAVGNSYMIGASSDAIVPWTATSGSLYNGNMAKWWSGRMVVTASAIPARIAASAIGDANYWSTTASGTGQQAWSVDLEPGDGDVIVGWAAVDSYLLIFKRRRCWAIYDGDTGANRVLSPDVGATSRYAVAETPHGVAFQAGDYSIWLASGTSVKRISDKVAPLCISAGAVGYAADHLYVSMPGMGTLDYDFNTDEWRRHSFLVSQFATQDFDDGQGQKLFGLLDPSSPGDNLLRLLDPDAVSDAGAPFYSFWASAHRKYGTEVLKRIRALAVEGTGDVDVTFSKEQGGDEFKRTVGLGSPWGQGRVLTPGVARSWGFRFQNDDEPFSLDAVSVDLVAKTR